MSELALIKNKKENASQKPVKTTFVTHFLSYTNRVSIVKLSL